MASFLYQTSLKEMRWPIAIQIARIFKASVKFGVIPSNRTIANRALISRKR